MVVPSLPATLSDIHVCAQREVTSGGVTFLDGARSSQR